MTRGRFRFNARGLATYAASAVTLAAVHTLFGERVAAGVALVAGVVLSQSAPVVRRRPPAQRTHRPQLAPSAGARVQAVMQHPPPIAPRPLPPTDPA